MNACISGVGIQQQQLEKVKNAWRSSAVFVTGKGEEGNKIFPHRWWDCLNFLPVQTCQLVGYLSCALFGPEGAILWKFWAEISNCFTLKRCNNFVYWLQEKLRADKELAFVFFGNVLQVPFQWPRMITGSSFFFSKKSLSHLLCQQVLMEDC